MQRPCLPDLKNLVEAEESSDEEGDEQHLLSILKKLKTAKSSIDTTKQRKRNRDTMNELFAQYTRDSQHLVERHNHRFKTNIAELTRKNNQIKEQCRQLVQKNEKTAASWEESLRNTAAAIEDAHRSLQRLADQAEHASKASDLTLRQEMQSTRQQVEARLDEVKDSLAKVSERSKDDKLTKLVNAFLSTL